MMLWMLGAAAAATNTLSLYLYPSTRRIDWESPTRLARSTLRSTLRGLPVEASMDLGHVAVSVQCGEEARWGGMSRRDKGESVKLVLRQGSGMGTLLHNFQGRLDSQEEIEAWSAVHAERGTLRVVDFALSDAQCQDLIAHMDDYRSAGQQHNYGLFSSPFSGDGAGCSAFAASFVEVAGLLDEPRRSAWSTTVHIPDALVGRHHQVTYATDTAPLQEPDPALPRVGFLSIALRSRAWAAPTDPDATALFFFSPDFMYDWAEAMLTQVGAPGGPEAITPVGAGWRLHFAPAPPDPSPALADLDFPGDPAVAAAARDVLSMWLDIHPDRAADAGLLSDGLHLPSFDPQTIADRLAALDAAAARLEALDRDGLPVADRIDLRLLIAAVAEEQHALRIEQRWRHRPAEWLEPVSTLLIAHTAAVVPIPGAVDTLAGQLPDMLEELRREVTAPTARDVETALGLLDGIAGMLEGLPPTPPRTEGAAALRGYAQTLSALEGLPEQQMIGAEAYRWRLENALLLPWSAEELMARAEADLVEVSAEIAALEASLPPLAPPTEEEVALAASLDQAGVLALYERMVSEDLVALRQMDVITVPDLPPMRARPTPPALIPLTGDGGSMNPIAPFGPTEGAWWNVEHFSGGSPEHLQSLVLFMRRHHQTWDGPYAVHEGVPGHHLQLAIARDVPRPVRNLLQSSAAVEGWALYAESLFEESGGFGGEAAGRLVMLRSYRARIKRVIFDVQVETGVWSLQEAADWKHGAAPGEGRVDPELLRTVQWPTQLIGYYAGKEEILALKAEIRQAWGTGFTERAFHDALLAQGSIPVSLAREALLAMTPEP